MRHQVTFLRSIETMQTVPFLAECQNWLAEEDVDAHLLYSDGNHDVGSFAGTATKVHSPGRLIEFRDALQTTIPDGNTVISISIPDENAVRDAVIAELDDSGRSFLTAGVENVLRFASKWETKAILERFDIPTPPGFYLDGDLISGRASVQMDYREALGVLCRRLQFPVILKPIWDCLGNGMEIFKDFFELDRWLDLRGEATNYLIEETRTGVLCSVEVISDGSSVFIHPLVWKGSAGGGLSFPFLQVRWSYSRLGIESLDPKLMDSISRMALELNLVGAFEFEFIWDERRFWCIEVNPRVSGSTSMSIATSGVNTYIELCRIAMNRTRVSELTPAASRFALQFPVVPTVIQRSDFDGSSCVLHRVSEFEVDGTRYASALVSLEEEDLNRFRDWCLEHAEILPDAEVASGLLEAVGMCLGASSISVAHHLTSSGV